MILIVADHAAGKLNKITAEMVTAARGLQDDTPVAILVLGAGVAEIANEAAQLAEQVLVADKPELQHYDAEVWAAAIAQIAGEGEAEYVLMAANRAGRECSPRVALKLDAALVENIIALSREDGGTKAQRYAYLARVVEGVKTESARVVATIMPGAFSAASPLAEAGEQFDAELTLPEVRVRVTDHTNERSARIALEEAEIVVSGGRGVGSAEGFQHYVETLADRLGAAVGATRALVDAGWRPYSEQVGQTGKTVQPKVYVAVGISGAVQHLSGMNKSKFIIAINKDAECPMIRLCDFGIVGNVAEIVPAILDALSR